MRHFVHCVATVVLGVPLLALAALIFAAGSAVGVIEVLLRQVREAGR